MAPAAYDNMQRRGHGKTLVPGPNIARRAANKKADDDAGLLVVVGAQRIKAR
jgi:hypothetical protein